MELGPNEFVLPCPACQESGMSGSLRHTGSTMRISNPTMKGCGCGCGGSNTCPCGCGGCGECRGQAASHFLGMGTTAPPQDTVSTAALLGVVGLGLYSIHLVTRNFAR